MGTQVTLVYTVTPLGATAAALGALVNAAAVPLPRNVLNELGLRVISDITAVGANVVRTVVLGFDPTVVAAVAALNLDSGGSIVSVIPVAGLDYVLPPLVRAVPPDNALLRSLLAVFGVTVDSGGAGYVAPVVTFMGGLPPARNLGTLSQTGADVVPERRPPVVFGCVRRISVKTPGLRYPIGTTCTLRGGGVDSSSPAIPALATPVIDANGRITSIILTDMGARYVKRPEVVLTPPVGFVPPRTFQDCVAFAGMAEGTPARAGVVTVALGVITAIAVASNGDGYVGLPDILIQDAAGVGAVATARMGVGRIVVVSPGSGLPTTTTITFTPVFQQNFPSTVPGNDPNQRRPFFRLLEASLSQAGFTPVVSSDPLVA